MRRDFEAALIGAQARLRDARPPLGSPPSPPGRRYAAVRASGSPRYPPSNRGYRRQNSAPLRVCSRPRSNRGANRRSRRAGRAQADSFRPASPAARASSGGRPRPSPSEAAAFRAPKRCPPPLPRRSSWRGGRKARRLARSPFSGRRRRRIDCARNPRRGDRKGERLGRQNEHARKLRLSGSHGQNQIGVRRRAQP